MRVKVRAFAQYAETMGREQMADLPAKATAGDLLHVLASTFPALANVLFTPSGELADTTIVMRNRRNIESEKGLATELADGDEVAIFPPVAGG